MPKPRKGESNEPANKSADRRAHEWGSGKGFKFAAVTAAVIVTMFFTAGTAAAGTENVNVVNTPTVNVGNTPT